MITIVFKPGYLWAVFKSKVFYNWVWRSSVTDSSYLKFMHLRIVFGVMILHETKYNVNTSETSPLSRFKI